MARDWGVELQDFIITHDDNIHEDAPVIKIAREDRTYDCMSLGNFSSIIGQAKSRKSFLATLFCCANLRGGLYEDAMLGLNSGGVVYVDTEQGKTHVQKIVRRVNTLAGVDKFTCYALRQYSPSDRVDAIDFIVRNTIGLKILVIDGIRDLIRDINSADESTMLVTRLMKWSGEFNIHIIAVLHQNPNDVKARGHIGTEVQNKSETVIQVKAGENGLSKVTCLFSRGLQFPEFLFRIEDGLPKIEGFDNYSDDVF